MSSHGPPRSAPRRLLFGATGWFWYLVRCGIGWLGFAFLLFVAAVGLHGILLCHTLDEAMPLLIALPVILGLALLVARKCLFQKRPEESTLLWMRVLPRDPGDDEEGDYPGGRPPDAPHPAPLRPNPPRVLSAAAELLDEEAQSVTVLGKDAAEELKEMLRKSLVSGHGSPTT